MSSLFNLKELSTLGGLEAGDLLAVDPQIYVKFLRHLSRTVRRDVITKNMVFLTALSAYTPEPINLFLRGESSIGKTYNVVQVLRYFLKEDVWLLGGLSPTALIHQHGVLVDENGDAITPMPKPSREASAEQREEWVRYVERLRKARTLIDLKGKILVFLEAPHFETFNMLRPILSHDSFQISYRFTDKTGRGHLQTQHVIIQGWPATIFCSTQEKYVHDLATRGFTITPEMSEKKYKAANKVSAFKAAYPWVFQKDFDQMMLEGYIAFFKEKAENVGIVDPLAEAFAEAYPSKHPRSMRDFPQILRLVRVYALFHLFQRPVLVRKVAEKHDEASEFESVNYKEEIREERYIIVTLRDYEFILALWRQIQETTETSAPGHILKFFHEVAGKLSAEKGEFTVEDATNLWNSLSEDKKSSKTVKRWISYLCEIGYITDRQDPTDRRRKIYGVLRQNLARNLDNYRHFQFIHNFKVETIKEWFKRAEKIWTNNTVTLRESLLDDRETSIEGIFQKHFLSENGCDVHFSQSQNQPSSAETSRKIGTKQKRPELSRFRAVYWSEGSYGWHKCAVCGQTKLTSWQAETFKGEKVWLCEDCKEAWEKQNVS